MAWRSMGLPLPEAKGVGFEAFLWSLASGNAFSYDSYLLFYFLYFIIHDHDLHTRGAENDVLAKHESNCDTSRPILFSLPEFEPTVLRITIPRAAALFVAVFDKDHIPVQTPRSAKPLLTFPFPKLSAVYTEPSRIDIWMHTTRINSKTFHVRMEQTKKKRDLCKR